MLKKLLLLASFTIFSVTTYADSNEYSFDFGLVFKNEMGEPVGFYNTEDIPLKLSDRQSLYGLVVTRNSDERFLLSVVHIFPNSAAGIPKKVLSKPMNVSAKGAIFFQTSTSDVKGDYAIEVYIDNMLVSIVNYALVDETTLEDDLDFRKNSRKQL